MRSAKPNQSAVLAATLASPPPTQPIARQTRCIGALCSLRGGGNGLVAAAEAGSDLRIRNTPVDGRPGITKAPDWPGPLIFGRNRRLLQRGADRSEVGGELGADAVD